MDPLAICSLHLHFPFFQIYSHSLETDGPAAVLVLYNPSHGWLDILLKIAHSDFLSWESGIEIQDDQEVCPQDWTI